MSEWKTQNTKCSNNNQLGLAMNKFAVAKAVVTRHLDAHNFVHTKRYVAILLCIWQLFPVRSLCGSFCLFLDTLIRLNSQITQCNYIVCSCVCVCVVDVGRKDGTIEYTNTYYIWAHCPNIRIIPSNRFFIIFMMITLMYWYWFESMYSTPCHWAPHNMLGNSKQKQCEEHHHIAASQISRWKIKLKR